ncbi:MAG: amidase [SAR202 cluster bacterium]|nr:amidase [SAR202 cluster bacterium]
MAPSELCYFTVAEASRRIADGSVSPVELTKAHLERIAALNGRVNAYLTVMEHEAMAAARRAEKALRQGKRAGPLHGIPIGLKDVFDVKSVVTSSGSKLYRDHTATADSAAAARLKTAGAVIIGKHQLHELAFGPTSENPHTGPARNPWDTERVTGGSSGGSTAAVAAGLCMAALGTDTGGSVRVPPALCGVAGLKPTFGRISRVGVQPVAFSLDTVGVIARNVKDTALVLNALAGHDSSDPSSARRPSEDFTRLLGRGIEGMRIGIPKEFFFDVADREVERAVRQAAKVMEVLGAVVDEVSIPALERTLDISTTIAVAEFAEFARPILQRCAAGLGGDVREVLEAGMGISAIDYIRCQQARSWYNRELLAAMRRCDLLLTPTSPIPAPRFDEVMVPAKAGPRNARDVLSWLTRPFNMSGMPAASVPCGFTKRGLPIGIQLAARPFREATLLQAAHAHEQATDWHKRRPPV